MENNMDKESILARKVLEETESGRTAGRSSGSIDLLFTELESLCTIILP